MKAVLLLVTIVLVCSVCSMETKPQTKQKLQKRYDWYACLQPKQRGYCNGHYTRYYYDYYTKTCKTFSYSGCGGNNNNFLYWYFCYVKCIA
uniref:BPTI/Kunitz inhibitor domain-containing protein n=1 Tax=Magallana gigas TaxID=29159 RepID=A0A8W8P0D1_MAGGI|nr:kunitz-type serine protease inhibitor BmKTT-3-like [Crassostrea gigas]